MFLKNSNKKRSTSENKIEIACKCKKMSQNGHIQNNEDLIVRVIGIEQQINALHALITKLERDIAANATSILALTDIGPSWGSGISDYFTAEALDDEDGIDLTCYEQYKPLSMSSDSESVDEWNSLNL